MNIRYGRAVVALIVSIVAWQTSATAQDASAIPYIYVDNRMVVECRINGQGPFALILDTGSPSIAITPETAKRLGLTVKGAGMVSGAGNSSVENGNATLARLSIGSVIFTDQSADVLDLTEIRTKLHFPHLDGIIGYPVLKAFATFVDVDDQTITFERTLPAIPSSAERTPFEGVLPEIHAVIDGIAGKVIVDSGDRSSLTLFGPFAKRHGFFGKYPSEDDIVTGYGLGGPVYADVFTLPRLDVFGSHLVNVVTRASRQTGGVFASTADSGSIGTGVLKRFNIVYDYPHHEIIAWPSRRYSTPDKFVPPGS